jgi:beta-N-acetylhexosaminidase
VADVDVEVMVGQMILLGFRGTTLTPDAPVVADLRDRHIGSLLIAAHDVPSGRPLRNIASPAQLAALSAAVQETAGRPVLLATDEEGGAVARLGPEFGFPATRSAADLGAAGDVDATRAAGAAIARTLRDAGIRLNLAPVVDVDTNPSNPVIGALGRSYSADPAVVAAQAGAFVAGHRDTGVLTCLKHFPGHGSSTSDSHAGFVDVSSTWQPLELDPYRSLIGAGLADAVMAAHVFNDRIDPTYPASLSSATITDLLRGELGFGGVVISDDLQMGAITQGWGLTDAIRLSVLAGTDILTFSNNLDTYDPDLGRTVHTTLLDLVRSGVVSEDRIAESYARITALTARVA